MASRVSSMLHEAVERHVVPLLKPIGLTEVVRTGKVAMFRGERVLAVGEPNTERAA